MKTIKKYWMAIVAGIAAIFAIFVVASTRRNKNKAEKINDQIKQNDSEIDKSEGHVEAIEEQRAEVVEDIKTTESEIDALKQSAEEVKPEVLDVAEAKENILKKTRRRKSKKS